MEPDSVVIALSNLDRVILDSGFITQLDITGVTEKHVYTDDWSIVVEYHCKGFTIQGNRQALLSQLEKHYVSNINELEVVIAISLVWEDGEKFKYHVDLPEGRCQWRTWGNDSAFFVRYETDAA